MRELALWNKLTDIDSLSIGKLTGSVHSAVICYNVQWDFNFEAPNLVSFYWLLYIAIGGYI